MHFLVVTDTDEVIVYETNTGIQVMKSRVIPPQLQAIQI